MTDSSSPTMYLTFRAPLVEFDSSSLATGALKVKYIVGDEESVIGDSLEVSGPISGYATARAHLRFHSGDSCESEVLYSEICRNCQQYISIKVLKSKKKSNYRW